MGKPDVLPISKAAHEHRCLWRMTQLLLPCLRLPCALHMRRPHSQQGSARALQPHHSSPISASGTTPACNITTVMNFVAAARYLHSRRTRVPRRCHYAQQQCLLCIMNDSHFYGALLSCGCRRRVWAACKTFDRLSRDIAGGVLDSRHASHGCRRAPFHCHHTPTYAHTCLHAYARLHTWGAVLTFISPAPAFHASPPATPLPHLGGAIPSGLSPHTHHHLPCLLPLTCHYLCNHHMPKALPLGYLPASRRSKHAGGGREGGRGEGGGGGRERRRRMRHCAVAITFIER